MFGISFLQFLLVLPLSDSTKLIKKSMESKLNSMLKNAGKQSEREIQEEDIFDISSL